MHFDLLATWDAVWCPCLDSEHISLGVTTSGETSSHAAPGTGVHSFSKSVPGCARCSSGCKGYSSEQTDGDSESQSSGDFRPCASAASLASPESGRFTSCSPRPWALPFLSYTCLTHHTIPSGFSVMLSPLCAVVGPACTWDFPPPALQICTRHLSHSILRSLLSSLSAFPDRMPAAHRRE